jgi:VTC domain-containing protein
MDTHPFAESGVTNVRREVKVLLDPDEADSVAGALARFMPPEESRIVAVYFDAPGAPLAQRASATPGDCVKVRVKAYAPDRSAVPGRVVLEVKREHGGITSKERLWLPLGEVRDAVASALAPTFGALAPQVASSYRRRVYQTTPHWRVTIDDGLTFHRAGWSLFADDAPQWHGGLGPALGAEPRVVVELKFGPDGMPRWLARLAWSRGTTYSKFAAAVGLGELVRPRGA